MEGPASEEAERLADEAARGVGAEPEPHFLGWLGDVDPDELFASGRAWGVTVRRVAAVQD